MKKCNLIKAVITITIGQANYKKSKKKKSNYELTKGNSRKHHTEQRFTSSTTYYSEVIALSIPALLLKQVITNTVCAGLHSPRKYTLKCEKCNHVFLSTTPKEGS